MDVLEDNRLLQEEIQAKQRERAMDAAIEIRSRSKEASMEERGSGYLFLVRPHPSHDRKVAKQI